MALAPCRPGNQAITTAAAAACTAGLPEGRPATRTRTTGGAGGCHRPDQVLLDTGQVERGAIAALPAGAVVGQARLAHHHHGRIGAPG